MAKNLLFAFVIVLVSGCTPSKKIIVSDFLDATPVVSGSVADPSAFAKGGTLVLGAFKPGPGASADDKTDQLSLMILKGFKDSLASANTNFNILTDHRQDPDCLLEGYIEDFGRDRHYSHLKLRKDQVHLSVSGDIWLRATGEKIVLFQTSTVIDLKTQNTNSVAYQIGVAIARFIVSR